MKSILADGVTGKDKLKPRNLIITQLPVNTYLPLLQSSQGESFLGRKCLIGKKIKKELDKPEGISHAKMV